MRPFNAFAAAALVTTSLTASVPASAYVLSEDTCRAPDGGMATRQMHFNSHSLELKNKQGDVVFYTDGVYNGIQLSRIAAAFCAGKELDFPLTREVRNNLPLIGPTAYECKGPGGSSTIVNNNFDSRLIARNPQGEVVFTKTTNFTLAAMAARRNCVMPSRP